MIKQYQFKGKKYYLVSASFTDSNGKRHQKQTRHDFNGSRFTSELQAKKHEVLFIDRLKSQANGDMELATFKDYQLHFLKKMKNQLKKATLYQYDGDLNKHLPMDIQNSSLVEIKSERVSKLFHQDLFDSGVSANSRKRILKHFRRVLREAVDEGVIPSNPANGIKIKVPPRDEPVLNSQEVNTLLREARKANHPFFYTWAFILFGGFRSGEAYSLRYSDIDDVSGVIKIRKQWTNKDGYHETKTNLIRTFELPNEIRNLLPELREIGPFSEELKGLNGSREKVNDLILPRVPEWRYGNAAKVLKEFCRLIGITQVAVKDLRATFITNLLSQNASQAAVMRIVGHVKVSTLDHYLRLAGVDTKGQADKISYHLPLASKDIGNVVNLADFRSKC